MPDPLSITASVVGITVPALHGIRLLLDDLQQLKDTPKIVKRLVEDVRSVETALHLLRGVEEREWNLLDASVAEELKTMINSCTHACDLFRTDLQQWTRHSDDGRLSWHDRTNVGFFKKGQMKAMSEQLQNCKLTINSVVSIATLYSSVRHYHVTEEMKKTISTKQAEVEGAITTTNKQLIVLESKIEELNLSNSEDEETTEPKEGKAEALRQLEAELKAVDASQRLLSELLLKAQEEAVTKAAARNPISSTTVTFGNQNSGFQAGVINGEVHGISFGEK